MVADAFALLLRGLELRDALSDDERKAVQSLPFTVRQFGRGSSLVAEGSRPPESCLILTGMAARVVYTPDGKRQITAIHIPGDFVDLHGLLLRVMDHHVIALSLVTAAFVPHPALRGISEHYPHLTRLLWMLTVIDAAIHRAWLTNIGRKSPQQHLCHLWCELYTRYEKLGLSSDGKVYFPVTQGELADMVGLSLVHVNRAVQNLRAKGLIKWSGTTVEIPSFERLAEEADFDPTYLSFSVEPR